MEPIDRIVSLVMSPGMVVTIVCYAIGLILLFLHRAPVPHTAQQYYHSLAGFFAALQGLEVGPFLYLGTAALILTPFILVLAAILTFVKQRERRFAFIAALVLMVMIASVVIASVFKIKIG